MVEIGGGVEWKVNSVRDPQEKKRIKLQCEISKVNFLLVLGQYIRDRQKLALSE